MSEPATEDPSAAGGPSDAPRDTDPIVAPKKSWWRRPTAWIVIVAILAAGAIVAWILSGTSSSETTDTLSLIHI